MVRLPFKAAKRKKKRKKKKEKEKRKRKEKKIHQKKIATRFYG